MTRGSAAPGAALGVLGAGQLGRMFAAAAVRMGYRVHVFAPDAEGSPAAAHAERAVAAPWEDEDALADFARGVAAVTLEFENVPTAALDAVARHAPVRPGREALHVAQNRAREKAFLARIGVPLAPWAHAETLAEARAALASVGAPAIVKTAGFGYDGKGQAAVDAPSDLEAAWRAVGGGPVVLEARVDLAAEASVVAARDATGRVEAFPLLRNVHEGGILDVTTTPAGLGDDVWREAREATEAVLGALDVVGVACVEFFVGTDGRLRANEIAPRPHNSGHLTIEAASASQFEQQVRATAGLPLAAPEARGPAAMANLLGDLWRHGEPDWAAALRVPGVALHLYGKDLARPGRKMGHLTALASDPAEAEGRVRRARAALTGGPTGPG